MIQQFNNIKFMKQNITVKKKGIVSLLAALCFGLAMMPLIIRKTNCTKI